MSPSKCYELKSLQPFYNKADELARNMHKYLDGKSGYPSQFDGVDDRAEQFVNRLDCLLIDVQGDRR